MTKVIFGEIIGRGMERVCYANPNNPSTCFKVSRLGHDLQTRREIRYFEYLKRKGIWADFLPYYYGFIKSENYLIIEQELLRSDENSESLLVNDFLKIADASQILSLEEQFRQIRDEMISKNIIVSDIRPANIMVKRNHHGSIERIVFLDGFGSPELIPLPMYCPFFGRKKILRQWEKFKRHYYNEKRKVAK